jgi:small-conductance mechanosensitive channel
LGIAITPLLTAFGVGGVSLGLALQGTLSNLMSGINIITSRKIQPGDYIQLKTGEEGYVVDIDLRHTVLQEITQSYLIIPNTKIIAASLRNYSLKKKEIILAIRLMVPYQTDLELLEGIVREVATEISTIHDIFESASIYYESFDYWNIILNVYLKVRESAQFEHLQVKHDFIKKLNKCYQEQGITVSIPLPWLTKGNEIKDQQEQ